MGVEEWLAWRRREMRPVLLKVGVAVSLSLAGYLYSRLFSRDDRQRPPHTVSGVDSGREVCGGLKDELLHLQPEDASSTVVNIANPTLVSPAIAGLPLRSMCSGHEKGSLPPEFPKLALPESEPVRVDTLTLETPHMKSSPETKEEKMTEQEIALLKTLVQSLQERERNMEIELLEYYRLKEQELAVLELENRLMLGVMEAEFLSLEIESLQAENRRLEAQAVDYERTKAALETARAKIKHLKSKMMSENKQAREKIAALQQSAAALQGLECRMEKEKEETERGLKRLKELEDEVAELKRANSKLSMENLTLAKKLESMQIVASSTPEFPEQVTKSLDRRNSLRQKNDELANEIEQLQTDRCADVEELVYLRWVNACLRYEMRNYKPPPGKVVARDLSRTLSPKSEHKVKQLIHEYANSGINVDGVNLVDVDLENCSSSQASSCTENKEVDDACTGASSTTTSKNNSINGKMKFFTKLRRLVLGKDTNSNKTPVDGSPTSCASSAKKTSISGSSFDEVVGRVSCDGAASCITLDNSHEKHPAAGGEQQQNESEWTQNLSRVSVDFWRLRNCDEPTRGEGRRSDVGGSCRNTSRTAACVETLGVSSLSAGADKETMVSPERFARVSKSPRGKKPRMHLRSSSFNVLNSFFS